MLLWKFFCVCCDGLFGDQIRPCHFMPEMIIMAVAAETTVDTLLMYSATDINHHMLHGRSEVNHFFYLEFKARSKAVRSTAGKGSLPPLPFFSPSLQYYITFLILAIRTVWSRLTKSTSFICILLGIKETQCLSL